MVRKMTPAQFRAAARKAERDYKRSVTDARRQVDKIKKALTDFDRAVRNHNSKARTHNRQVENQHRRMQQEIARLRSRPASTTYTAYRTTATALVETYTDVETRLTSRPGTPIDQHFLDMASDETANSVYLVNALDGDGEPEDDPTEDALRKPSKAVELAAFGPDLVHRWTGALYALSPDNPDAARHFCTSAREIIITMLDSSAPDAAVKQDQPGCEVTDKGAPTRRSKINYLLKRHGVTVNGLTDVVEQDVKNLLALFGTFNSGTHGHAGRFTITELSAIRTRVESAIDFIHQVIGKPATN